MDDQASLGQMLGPVLRDACGGRLGKISWFRATWQHGGAATGFSTWRCPDGRRIDCVVKLPVGYTEYFWTKRLGLTACRDWDGEDACAIPTPRVLAAGFELGSYDFAWLVLERFPGLPLASTVTSQSVWEMFETAAEFHAAAVTERSVEPEAASQSQDWTALVDRAMAASVNGELPESERWRHAIDRVRDSLDGLAREWDARDIDSWCHLDLHGRNAMRRESADPDHPGRCALIDLALVRSGHWVEDALYFERLCWGHEDRLLCGIDPVPTLARAREFIGLPIGADYERLADVRRVLMASTAPSFLRTEGDPVYLNAALERLETLIPAVLA